MYSRGLGSTSRWEQGPQEGPWSWYKQSKRGSKRSHLHNLKWRYERGMMQAKLWLRGSVKKDKAGKKKGLGCGASG